MASQRNPQRISKKIAEFWEKAQIQRIFSGVFLIQQRNSAIGWVESRELRRESHVFCGQGHCMSAAEDIQIQQLRQGGEQALAQLFADNLQRLERIIRFRIDSRIRGRVDAADVLQEAYLTAARRLPEFLSAVSSSWFVWLRQLTLQTLTDVHRREFCQRRDAGREVRLAGLVETGNTSLSIASFLIDQLTSPSQQIAQAEELQQLQEALNSMPEIDREVLALRHFERLSNLQTAEILGLSPTAASNRYVRAAARLTEILQHFRRHE